VTQQNCCVTEWFEVQTKAGGAAWQHADHTVGDDGSSLGKAPTSITAVRYAQSDWPLVTLHQGGPASGTVSAARGEIRGAARGTAAEIRRSSRVN
jgi:hypothetical protein